MAKTIVEQRVGLSLLPALGILFIVLKLLGKIDWSWWWVLAPFWAPATLVILFGILYWWWLNTK